jgi:hypothetical protein
VFQLASLSKSIGSTVAEHLCEIPHIQLLTSAMEKHLTRVDPRTIKGEMVGRRKK